jgi:phage gpG-like protein
VRVIADVNLGGIDSLIAAAERVDNPAQIAREAVASVPMIESLYKLGFEREEAPDGSGWAPPKHDYGHPLMRDTRDLQNGAEVSAEADGVRITVNVPYAKPHQEGTANMEARKIVPDTALGDRWDRQIGLARMSTPPEFP